MKLSFLGAAHEVTGSCTLLEVAGKCIMVDCGMEQGKDIYENCDLPIAPSHVDYVFLTHAHIDHSGKLPYLVAQGYQGPIYTTYASKRLCDVMLRDSAHIQESEAEWRNRKAKRSGQPPYEPLYTVQHATTTVNQMVPCNYDKLYDIAPGIQARFLDAGHLLGSASIELTVTEGEETRVLLFSGDIGNIDRPLIRDPKKPLRADVVVMESTYGDRYHGERKDYVGQLTRIIQETLDRGGNVVIPAFAVGRTQELLYLIYQIKKNGLVEGHPNFPVWVDSPMAVEATNIYSDDMVDYYDEETLAFVNAGTNPLRFPGLHLSVTSDESKAINFDVTPKVILSASGMCEAGRIRHHLKHNLWREDSTILFVGYQSEGTLGRKLLDGSPVVKLFGEEITVNAHLEQMDGISGHADCGMLMEWIGNLETAPSQVYINHGEDEVCDTLAGRIRDELHYPAVAPYNAAVYDVLTGECLEPGNHKRIEKKKTTSTKAAAIFQRLVQAGKYLQQVIQRNRGGTNRDLENFANQVEELARKWDIK